MWYIGYYCDVVIGCCVSRCWRRWHFNLRHHWRIIIGRFTTQHYCSSFCRCSKVSFDPLFFLFLWCFNRDYLINSFLCVWCRAASGHERVRANAVRALGHFARFAPRSVLLKRDTTAVSNADKLSLRDSFSSNNACDTMLFDIVSTLLTRLTSGSAKTRWNACYALGRFDSFSLFFFKKKKNLLN